MEAIISIPSPKLSALNVNFVDLDPREESLEDILVPKENLKEF